MSRVIGRFGAGVEVRSWPGGGRARGVVLALLAVLGPISMDLYLPVLPALTTELGVTASAAQVSITACLIGLAFGQVIAGPLSDRFGRRRPLLVGLGLYVFASVLCGASPTIEVLLVARLAQGLAGAVGIVIAQAAGRDLYSGGRLVRYLSRLTVIAGLAAIAGPVVGGQLAAVTDWRGVFLVLAAVGALLLVVCVGVVAETLPPERRVAGGGGQLRRDFAEPLHDRVFVGAVLIAGFVYAATFAYLSGATFVLQGIYGLSPQQYSYAFGLNSLGFVICGFLAGRLSARWSERGTLKIGLFMCAAGASALLACGLFHLILAAVIASLFTMVSGVATTTPPATALALAEFPHIAGTAAALLGLTRYAFGGLAAPLVGLRGADTAVPLGIVTTTCAVLAAITYAATMRDPRASQADTHGRRRPTGQLQPGP